MYVSRLVLPFRLPSSLSGGRAVPFSAGASPGRHAHSASPVAGPDPDC